MSRGRRRTDLVCRDVRAGAAQLKGKGLFLNGWNGAFLLPRLLPAESATRIWCSEWDTLSRRVPWRKLCPGFRLWSGMPFPDQPSSGNCVPESSFKPGCAFRLSLQTETASRNQALRRDALSRRASGGKCIPEFDFRTGCIFPMTHNRKLCPGMSARNGMNFPNGVANGNCIPE